MSFFPKNITRVWNSFQEKTASYWDSRYEERLSNAYKIRDWTESKYVLENYIHPLVSGHPNKGWLQWFTEKFIVNKPYDKALDLGCGSGGIERYAFELNLFRHMDAFDISQAAIVEARKQGRKYGYSGKVSYKCQDFSTLKFKEDFYDTVFMSMSLHHVLDIESVLETIKKAKKKERYFVLHEYIGANRFQWTDTQIEHGNRLLNLLPDELKVDCDTGEVRRTFDKPPLSLMLKFDPSEAIRSADIMGLVSVYFDVVERRDYGGTILQPLLGNIIHNFEPENVPKHRDVLDFLFEEEQKSIKNGILPSNFTVLVLK